MQYPLISIVIPTYNNGHFFNRLLNSLLNQSYKNWEAIIIDNNSTDSTLSIISQYNDSRIRVHLIENNGIIAKSRNLGIQKATGEWVAFLDSDDWWDNNKLSRCSNYFKCGYAVIYHKLEINNGQITQRKRNLYSRKSKKNFFKDLLINGNFIPNSSVLIKKDILEKVGAINEDLEMVGSEDFNLWLRVSKYTNKVKYIRTRLGYYYISDHSISQKNMSLCYKYAVRNYLSECNSHENKLINTHLIYLDVRYKMKSQNLKHFKKALIFCLINGTLRIKIKAMYYLFFSLFYRLQIKTM